MYREDVHAIYSTLGRKFGVYGVQGGLRLEQVFTEALWEGDQSFENDYFSVYPSFNLSKQRNDEVSWIASYSRRVNRPRGRSVTPFIDDSDSRNIRTGNPELRPEYTNSMEIGHHGRGTGCPSRRRCFGKSPTTSSSGTPASTNKASERPVGSTKGNARMKDWKLSPWPRFLDAAGG